MSSSQKHRQSLIEAMKKKYEDRTQKRYPDVGAHFFSDKPAMYRKRLVRRADYLAERIALAEQPPQKVKWDQHELEALCWALACIDELIGRRADASVE